MIQAQQELLDALRRAARRDGAGARLALGFESPKQAAHGDLAITAAMPLATRCKSSPRALAERW